MTCRTLVLVGSSWMWLAACSGASGNDDANDGSTSTSTSNGETTETEASSTSDSEASTDEAETGTDTNEDPPRPERLLLTADWRAKRISLLDYAAIRDGASTRDAALWKSIELEAYEPGPIEAELTPDGSLAVVAIGPGFFASGIGGLAGAGPGSIPEGGALLIVDVDSGSVLAELETAQYPLGIAITQDGSAAWTANFGGNGQSGTTLSHIDLGTLTIVEEIEVGPGPEQIAFDGPLAAINVASDGTVRLFDLADPVGTLSPGVVVSNDPSWVLHMSGGDRVAVTNSLGPPGYSLLDTSDPLAPVVLDTIEVVGIPYAATYGYNDDQILMTSVAGLSVAIQLYDTTTGELLQQIDAPYLGFPLGIAFDAEAGLALVPIPGVNVLFLADFDTGETRTIEWQELPGPTYVALEG
jgi:DNA-binding beta-propeller fold protein YncE